MRPRLVIGVLVLSLLSGCGQDPKSVRVTDANKDKLIDNIKDLEGLTIDESRLLLAYLMRDSLASKLGQTPPSMVGKTVADLIADQRTFETDAKKREDEQTRLAAEAKAKEDAFAAELRKAINFTVFEKGFLDASPTSGRFQAYITIKCAYQNTSPKDIRAFTGAVRFTDLFDKPIFESGLTVSDPIKAGDKGTWIGTIDYNQFVDSHRALRNAELKDMKIVWVPKSVIYADGTKIGGTVN